MNVFECGCRTIQSFRWFFFYPLHLCLAYSCYCWCLSCFVARTATATATAQCCCTFCHLMMAMAFGLVLFSFLLHLSFDIGMLLSLSIYDTTVHSLTFPMKKKRIWIHFDFWKTKKIHFISFYRLGLWVKRFTNILTCFNTFINPNQYFSKPNSSDYQSLQILYE